MTALTKRAIMEAMGYSVHERSAHIGRAWDWSPKGPMQSSHFATPEAAWMDAEDHYDRFVERARLWLRVSGEAERIRANAERSAHDFRAEGG